MIVQRSTTDTAKSPERGARSASAGSPGAGPLDHPVIFFDGVCGLCNHWIDFVAARDRQGSFRFAPLQGKTAREHLGPEAAQSLSSVVLLDAAEISKKSDAVWRMLMRLGGIWRIAGWLLWLIPRPIRNWGYDVVARRRYRWFGQKETCRLPTPAERARFLP